MTTARRSLAGLLAPIIALFACTAGAQDLELVSRQGGTQGNSLSVEPSISADGGFVAFASLANNLIPGGDANGSLDVFVFDRTTGALDLVSRKTAADGGAQGNNGSFSPSISADGRFVAFASNATNLIPGGGLDANGTNFDIYVFDRTTSALELVSRQGAAQGNSHSRRPSISDDGRYVAFESQATNLIPGSDVNGTDSDVFVFDRTTGALELVSRQATADGGAQGDNASFSPSISADGGFVAFQSDATNLIPGGGLDANTTDTDVFVFDRTTDALELVSRQAAADGGAQADSFSFEPSISGDGRYVAFISVATNLIPGGGLDANGADSDVFVFDRTTDALELVSRQAAADGGAQGNFTSPRSSISADGRFVAFESQATNLIPGGGTDTNGALDVFVFDRTRDSLKLVSRQAVADGGAQGDSVSRDPSISADGGFIAFESQATNLIPGGGSDANGASADVFVRSLEVALPKAMPWLLLLLGDE